MLQRNDPMVKPDSPREYILLYPNLSASHPEVGSITAIASISRQKNTEAWPSQGCMTYSTAM